MAEMTFTGLTPSECHKQLLEAINESRYWCILCLCSYQFLQSLTTPACSLSCLMLTLI